MHQLKSFYNTPFQYSHSHPIGTCFRWLQVMTEKLKSRKFWNRNSSSRRCPMDLWNFPHDVQACTMRFRSYAYFAEELNFTLMSLRENERFLQNDAYSLEGLDGAVGTTRTCLEKNKCRNYAEAVVTLMLKRDITFYAYQVSQFFTFEQSSMRTIQVLVLNSVFAYSCWY